MLTQQLLDADFRDALLGLGNLLGGPDMLPEVLCNTLPAHLLEPRFLDAVIELAEEAGGLDTLRSRSSCATASPPTSSSPASPTRRSISRRGREGSTSCRR